MTFTEEDALEYMKMWIQDNKWDDLSIMYNNGESEMMADYLVSAGALNSKRCYDEYKDIEKYCEKLAKKFRKLSSKKQQKYYDLLFKDVIIISCEDCNSSSFVPDKNEELYPELLQECFECKSKKIDIRKGL